MTWIITADRPIYLQLVEQLELAIVAGEYRAGGKLPSVRELAAEAAVRPQHDAAGYAGAGGTWPHQHAADSWAYHYGG